jgi:hypothetical protein
VRRIEIKEERAAAEEVEEEEGEARGGFRPASIAFCGAVAVR